jgi:hypothetical protein
VPEWGVPRSETRTVPYQELVRRVIDHHRARGELVDFWLMKGGAIVGSYRVRPRESSVWKDLLPTGTSAERYQRVVGELGEILFPGEEVTLKAIERTNGEVRLTVESAT